MKRISLTITGKVQGVFYRATTEKTARQIGVTGFVRNEPNGDVYIEAQGTEAQLQQLTEWCRRGPERAEVKEVRIAEKTCIEENGFRVQR